MNNPFDHKLERMLDSELNLKDRSTSDFTNYFIDSLLYFRYFIFADNDVGVSSKDEDGQAILMGHFGELFDEFTKRLSNGEIKLKNKNEEEIPFKTKTPSSNSAKLLYLIGEYLYPKGEENIVQRIEEMLTDDSLTFDSKEYEEWIKPALEQGSHNDKIIQKIKNANLKFSK